MRLAKRERNTQEFFDLVLNQANEITLAFNDKNAPYVLPFNFAYEDGKIYIHCAHEGHKIDLIRENPSVGFCATCDVEILPEEATTAYRSVVGKGVITIEEDENIKQRALDMIAYKYKASCDVPANPQMIKGTCVLILRIEEINGKQRERKA